MLITFAKFICEVVIVFSIFLFAVYWVVRKAIRDELKRAKGLDEKVK